MEIKDTGEEEDILLNALETSEPAPTSLTPRQATLSPLMEGRRNSFLSSSEPNLQTQTHNDYVTPSLCFSICCFIFYQYF